MTQDLARLAEHLCSAGLLTDARVLPADALTAEWAQFHRIVQAIDGTARVDGRDLALRLGLPIEFPDCLPKVFVRDPELPGRIPHVFPHGYVCYQEQEGVLLDRHRPVEVAREALARALETLRRGLAGENHADFIEELALYWPGDTDGLTFFTAGDHIEEVFRVILPFAMTHGFVRDRVQARALILSDTLAPLAKIPKVVEAVDSAIEESWCRGLYIPLRTVPQPLVPFPLGTWSPTQLARLIRENLSDEDRRTLDGFTRSIKRDTFVLLRVPRPRGDHHLVGIRYDNVRDAHPLARTPGAASISQFRVERRDPGYLLQRGGAAAGLRDRRVLLAGCGAIGGYLALELIRCGVGHLTLVDPDFLRPENQHRHVLGAPPMVLLPSKAELLAAEIQRRYPGVHAKGLTDTIDRAIARGAVDPVSFDLVVSATGDPNVDRSLNQRLHPRARRPSLLFTWLEPLGIGGHAFTSPRSPANAHGCLDCLFTPHACDPAPALANRAAFAAPGQDFTRELAGCGNAFTPYSSLDALRTAELAVRLAIEVLCGEVTGPALRSWKGSRAAFDAANYRTSDRYDLAVEDLERLCIDLVAERCPVCGNP